MFHKVQSCLSPESLQQIGHNELSPDELSSIEEHVSGCDHCRKLFDGFYQSADWRESIQPALSESCVAASLRGAEDFTADVVRPEENRLRESILDLLGPTDDPNMLGRIGAYEIIGLLGQGGMGAVFKGFDRSLNRFVAIKMLLPHLAASGAARQRFAREGQAVAAVVDDHVMAIHCVDQWQGVPYLVMTYSRGVSLQKRLSDNGPLDVREILRIGMQAAKGLAAAHAQGIVHRDIKPANIFLDQSVERVQLMDFGLARAVDDASLTRSGTLAGTPQYMSPEQARAETVDHRSDLFSLGSVMYAMCTGHAPFRAESSYSVLRLITDKEPRPIREINPDIPEWLNAIICRLMAKQASDRFASAREVAELLEACLAHVQQPSVTSLPESLVDKPAPRSLPGEAIAGVDESPAESAKAKDQPPLGKTLQQLQGKWRLSRQIDATGDESGTPAIAVWEFKGDRIIVRDGGPGGALLIQVDDTHKPAHVNLTIEIDDEFGLGLLSVEGDKAIFCLGKAQKEPDPKSRPEKLQWVNGVWYMELTRVKPGEKIVPLKPKVEPARTESIVPSVSPNR